VNPAVSLNMLDPIKGKSDYLSTLKEHHRLQAFVSKWNHRNLASQNFLFGNPEMI